MIKRIQCGAMDRLSGPCSAMVFAHWLEGPIWGFSAARPLLVTISGPTGGSAILGVEYVLLHSEDGGGQVMRTIELPDPPLGDDDEIVCVFCPERKHGFADAFGRVWFSLPEGVCPKCGCQAGGTRGAEGEWYSKCSPCGNIWRSESISSDPNNEDCKE